MDLATWIVVSLAAGGFGALVPIDAPPVPGADPGPVRVAGATPC